MSASKPFGLSKEERICSKKLIDQLFTGGIAHAMSAFPLRVVYMNTERNTDEPQAKMLVSVPKRCFKRAVKRNRVKRQLREAYRLNKERLISHLATTPEKGVAMAFIWLDNKLYDHDVVDRQMRKLLKRIVETL